MVSGAAAALRFVSPSVSDAMLRLLRAMEPGTDAGRL